LRKHFTAFQEAEEPQISNGSLIKAPASRWRYRNIFFNDTPVLKPL
jgi:hypothetical protein